MSPFGYEAISTSERRTTLLTVMILFTMPIAAWGFMGTDWNYTGVLNRTETDKITSISSIMTVIGIVWSFIWLIYTCDYSCFVSNNVPHEAVQEQAYSASSSPSSGLVYLAPQTDWAAIPFGGWQPNRHAPGSPSAIKRPAGPPRQLVLQVVECAALYTVLYASVTAGATDTTQPGDDPLESSFQPDDGSNCATSFTLDPDTGTDAE